MFIIIIIIMAEVTDPEECPWGGGSSINVNNDKLSPETDTNCNGQEHFSL